MLPVPKLFTSLVHFENCLMKWQRWAVCIVQPSSLRSAENVIDVCSKLVRGCVNQRHKFRFFSYTGWFVFPSSCSVCEQSLCYGQTSPNERGFNSWWRCWWNDTYLKVIFYLWSHESLRCSNEDVMSSQAREYECVPAREGWPGRGHGWGGWGEALVACMLIIF